MYQDVVRLFGYLSLRSVLQHKTQRPFKIELYYNYINNFGQLVHKLKDLKDCFSNEHEETLMPYQYCID